MEKSEEAVSTQASAVRKRRGREPEFPPTEEANTAFATDAMICYNLIRAYARSLSFLVASEEWKIGKVEGWKSEL